MKARSQIEFKRKLLQVAVASCFTISTAQANPTGATVVHGGATFATSGNTLTITNTPNAIINWNKFSIGTGEITRFIQQSASSSVLNRVTGGDPSQILGSLLSNGKVFLINPNGVVFGQGSVVDVGGLVASSLTLSDSDFLAGRLNFTETPGAGVVRNDGSINTATGGQVYLVAPDVTNTGVITSPQGEIILAAGRSVYLVDPANPLIQVELTAPANASVNVGKIVAEGGRIGVYGGLVRNGGTVSASSAVMQGGKVVFRASQGATLDAGSVASADGTQGGSVTVQSTGGTTMVAGSISATGSQDKGGAVQMLGQNVALVDHAAIDASGLAGGGSVLVGGDYRGENPLVQNAAGTWVGAGTSIRADALANGDGGKVIVWSEDATRVYGSISARGGAQGGNGGFVETSGHYLDVVRAPDVSAPLGHAGTWLLDPYNITVIHGVQNDGSLDSNPDFTANADDSTISDEALIAILNSGATAIIDTNQGNGINQPGDITIDLGQDTLGVAYTLDATGALGGSLVLNADGKVLINSDIVLDGSLTILSDRNSVLNVSSSGIDTLDDGRVTIRGSLISNNGNIDITTYSGDIKIGDGSQDHAISLHAPSISMHNLGAGDITVGDSLSAFSVDITGTDFIAETQAGNVKFAGGSADGSYVNVIMFGDISVTTAAGDIVVQGGAGANSDAGLVAAGFETILSGGDVSLQGGAGLRAEAYILLDTGGVQQEITSDSGLIKLNSGSGAFASASISNNSTAAQSINGGYSGDAFSPATTGGIEVVANNGNDSFISSQGQQWITAGTNGILVRGGNTGADGNAFIESLSDQIIATGGNVSVIGGNGAGNLNDAAILASGSGNQNLYFLQPGLDLVIQGGTVGTGNSAQITSDNYQFIGGYDGADGNTCCGPLAANDPSISIQGGASGSSNMAGLISQLGMQEIHGKSLIVRGGAGGTQNAAMISAQGTQALYLGSSGLVVQGGAAGTNNFAQIDSFTTQDILTGGSVSVLGGAGGGNYAKVSTGEEVTIGGGYQNIFFTDASLILSVQGGSGTNSHAAVKAHGNQLIQGYDTLAGAYDGSFDPSIIIKGGSGIGSDAGIGTGGTANLTGGTQDVFANSVTLVGGAGNDAGAYFGVEGTANPQTITIAGLLKLTGGTGNNSEAGIGSDNVNTDITVIADSVSLVGGSGSEALIGALGAGLTTIVSIDAVNGIDASTGTANNVAIGSDGVADVTLTSNGNIKLGTAHIGSLSDAGTVVIDTSGGTGDVNLGNANIGGAGTVASSVTVNSGGDITMASAKIGSQTAAATVILDTTVSNSTIGGSGSIDLGASTVGGGLASTVTLLSGGNIQMTNASVGSTAGAATVTFDTTAGTGFIHLNNATISGEQNSTFDFIGNGDITATAAHINSTTGTAGVTMDNTSGSIGIIDLGNAIIAGAAAGSNLTFDSAGSLTLGTSGVIGGVGGDSIGLTAGNGITLTGNATVGSSGNGNTVNLTTTGGSIALNNAIVNGDTGAIVNIISAGGITATGAKVGSENGVLTTLAMTSNGGDISLGASTVGGGTSANIGITSSADIILGNAASIGSAGGQAVISMTAGAAHAGGDITLNNAHVGSNAASLTGSSVTLNADSSGGGISQGATGVIRTASLTANAKGSGVDLIGDNVVTNSVTAVDSGLSTVFGDVVVNLQSTDSLNAGATSIPSSVTITTGAGANHLAQVGFIGDADVSTSSISLSGDSLSVFGTGNLTVGALTLTGGAQGTDIRSGAGKDLTVTSAVTSANSMVLAGKNIDTQGLTSANGSVSVIGTGALTVGGNVQAATNVVLAGTSATVSGGLTATSGFVGVTATTGTVDAGALAAGTNVSISGVGATLGGDITATSGFINIDGKTAAVSSSGVLSAETNIDIAGQGVSVTGNVTANSGDIDINGKTGAVTIDGSISANNSTGLIDVDGGVVAINNTLAAKNVSVSGRNVTINAALTAQNNLGLSGTSLLVNGVNLVATNTLGISGGAVTMTGGSASANKIVINSGSFNASGYSFISSIFNMSALANATFASGSNVDTGGIDVSVGGDMFVDASTIHGDPDVKDILVGGKLYLDNNGRVESGAPASIYLDFPNLTSGGYVVDGVEGAITGGSGSGFYANGLPAVLNVNLHVTYGNQEVGEFGFITHEINDAGESIFEVFGEGSTTVLGDEGEDKDKDKECS